MSIETLAETAQAMVAPGKGILAIDESTSTISRRFEAVGIAMIGTEDRAHLTPVLTDRKHATNIGLVSAVSLKSPSLGAICRSASSR